MYKGELFLALVMFFALAGIVVWEWAARQKERKERKERANEFLQVLQMGLSMVPIFLGIKNHQCGSSDEGEVAIAANADRVPVDPTQFLGKLLVRVSSDRNYADMIPLSSIASCAPHYSAETGILEKATVKTTDGQEYIVYGPHPAQCLLDALNCITLNPVVMFKHDPQRYSAIYVGVAMPCASQEPEPGVGEPTPAQNPINPVAGPVQG